MLQIVSTLRFTPSTLCDCRTLTVVHCPAQSSCSIRDSHLLAIATHCVHLREFRLTDADEVTNVGVRAMLQMCGSKLAKLTLMRCKKLSRRSLLAIIEHCPDLEELTLVLRAITKAVLMDKLILSDPLKMLRKLTVCRTMHMCEQQSRWRFIVHSICATRRLFPVARIFLFSTLQHTVPS